VHMQKSSYADILVAQTRRACSGLALPLTHRSRQLAARALEEELGVGGGKKEASPSVPDPAPSAREEGGGEEGGVAVGSVSSASGSTSASTARRGRSGAASTVRRGRRRRRGGVGGEARA
jgi:hypothetical protein